MVRGTAQPSLVLLARRAKRLARLIDQLQADARFALSRVAAMSPEQLIARDLSIAYLIGAETMIRSASSHLGSEWHRWLQPLPPEVPAKPVAEGGPEVQP